MQSMYTGVGLCRDGCKYGWMHICMRMYAYCICMYAGREGGRQACMHMHTRMYGCMDEWMDGWMEEYVLVQRTRVKSF